MTTTDGGRYYQKMAKHLSLGLVRLKKHVRTCSEGSLLALIGNWFIGPTYVAALLGELPCPGHGNKRVIYNCNKIQKNVRNLERKVLFSSSLIFMPSKQNTVNSNKS